MLTAEELQAIRERASRTWPDLCLASIGGRTVLRGTGEEVAALYGAGKDRAALLAHIDEWTAIIDAWNAGAAAASVARLPRAHVSNVYNEQTQPDLFRAWLDGWDADAWAPGGQEYEARVPEWLAAPPIVPPETEAWVWMEHRADPVRVRECREGVEDVLWWDDDVIGVGDPPYQKEVGWRLWMGNGEGRRWATCVGPRGRAAG